MCLTYTDVKVLSIILSGDYGWNGSNKHFASHSVWTCMYCLVHLKQVDICARKKVTGGTACANKASQPYVVVEKWGFQQMIKLLERYYTIPPR